ncbi:MAG: 16S rRNA (cytidine(1402)-2'-O)-methyltransferase, partial [Gammaproteobacteria bacterium]
PARAAARRKRLGEIADETRTLIFYEAPHRLTATLADCASTLGAEREAALARELTKLHETVRRASLGELARLVADGGEPARGECVMLISGAAERASGSAGDDEVDVWLNALLAEGVRAKTAAAVIRRLSGQPRRRLYQRALELKP